MAEKPALRASDADRERVAGLLGAHAGEGRLTVDELDERTATAYAARTLPELDALLADLPATTAAPAARLDQPVPEEEELTAAFRSHLTTYLLVQLLLIGIWAATGAGFFWPVFPALGWGFGVAMDHFGTREEARRLRAAPPEQRAAILATSARRREKGCGVPSHPPRRLQAPPRP